MAEFWNAAVDTVVGGGKAIGGAACEAAGKFGADSQACHKVVDGTADKIGEAAKDPVGTAVKTALEGPINDFLISLWTGAVNFFRHLFRHGFMLVLLLVLKKTQWTG